MCWTCTSWCARRCSGNCPRVKSASCSRWSRASVRAGSRQNTCRSWRIRCRPGTMHRPIWPSWKARACATRTPSWCPLVAWPIIRWRCRPAASLHYSPPSQCAMCCSTAMSMRRVARKCCRSCSAISRFASKAICLVTLCARPCARRVWWSTSTTTKGHCWRPRAFTSA
ncbi:hypothetical protein D3C72_1684880 [compost metagenome]